MDPELARDVDDTIAELRSYGHHPTADLLQRLWNHINTPNQNHAVRIPLDYVESLVGWLDMFYADSIEGETLDLGPWLTLEGHADGGLTIHTRPTSYNPPAAGNPHRLYRVFFHHARGPISGCASIDYEGPITPDRIDQITQDAATEIGIPAHALVITGWAPYDQPQEQR